VINNKPDEVPMFWNMIYLVFSRPIFIIGFTFCTFPVLLGCPLTNSLKSLFSHDFWVPFSRLSYGAYLINPIFMVFRQFNTERGQWGCAFDAVLFFFSFLTFSFVFSFFIGIFVELPCLSLWYEFTIKKDERSEDVFDHSKSAKSGRGYSTTGGSGIGRE
jgi:peptidoglycan/LPS O-acetylase OafA/YrhL